MGDEFKSLTPYINLMILPSWKVYHRDVINVALHKSGINSPKLHQNTHVILAKKAA